MYGNIRQAIDDIVAGYDSSKYASAIEAEVHEDFTHMELCAINEQLGRMNHNNIVESASLAGLDKLDTDSLLYEFFRCVSNAL